MRLKPASDHGRPFMIREVLVVGHNHLLVMWVIRDVDEVLDIFENNVNEGVIVSDSAVRQPLKNLPHQLLCVARIMLLGEVNVEVLFVAMDGRIPPMECNMCIFGTKGDVVDMVSVKIINLRMVTL